MTQPTSVDMTFDTSLIDLKPNTSFSTTESDPSDPGPSTSTNKLPSNQQTSPFQDDKQQMPKPLQPLAVQYPSPSEDFATEAKKKDHAEVRHVPTEEAYNQWASVYDSDGNMLQSIDDLELPPLLTALFARISHFVQEPDISLLDLGCGTGRNTAKLISHWPETYHLSVYGLDFSKGMLDVAARKLGPLIDAKDGRVSLRLECCDCFPTVKDPSASPLPVVPNLKLVNAVISTLVLEHIPLRPYFATLYSLLSPNGMALVTNMHADMGRISQAGFVNAQGVKIRGCSFAHTVQETIDEARKAGFTVVSVKERNMTKEDVESGMVGERGRKWIGVKIWYGMLLTKTASNAEANESMMRVG